MKNLTAVTLILLLSACASAPATEDADLFTSMALEWQGAHINEMIEVWGDPRMLEQFSNETGAGTATWIVIGQFDKERARCQATALFDNDGVIRSLEVISKNCKNPSRGMPNFYGDIDALKRPD
jgi:hypothetical protein